MGKRLIGALLLVGLACGCGGELPRSGGRTASYWAEVLKKEDVGQRRKAAAKLVPLVLTDEAALLALLGALKDSDVEVRATAAWALGVFSGRKGPEVLPALRELQQQDADPKVREAAATAVKKLEAGSN